MVTFRKRTKINPPKKMLLLFSLFFLKENGRAELGAEKPFLAYADVDARSMELTVQYSAIIYIHCCNDGFFNII